MKRLVRLWALLRKERKEMLRESSSIAIGIVLPILLLLIFGFGLSLDVKNVRLGIVVEENGAAARQVVAAFAASPAFATRVTANLSEATDQLAHRGLDAVVVLAAHPEEKSADGVSPVSVLINSTCASIARAYENAIRDVLTRALAQSVSTEVRVVPRARMWFNDANNSSWFLVPGVIVLTLALIGCMLTSLQVAKEYEHGTMESLFATPVSPVEILLAKMLNNFLLASVALAIALVFSRFVFGVPMRGSLVWILAGSALFLFTQMGLGLVISSATKSQFLAAQISTIVSFLPVFMLSGFLFEIPNMPRALQVISYLMPPRYYVEFLQTSFLVGDVWKIYLRDFLPLVAFTIFFLALAWKLNPKRSAA